MWYMSSIVYMSIFVFHQPTHGRGIIRPGVEHVVVFRAS